jgi:hypothetical protein
VPAARRCCWPVQRVAAGPENPTPYAACPNVNPEAGVPQIVSFRSQGNHFQSTALLFWDPYVKVLVPAFTSLVSSSHSPWPQRTQCSAGHMSYASGYLVDGYVRWRVVNKLQDVSKNKISTN